MIEYKLDNFFGGMADSIREQSPFKFDVAKHFDIFSDPKRLIPYKTIVANNTGLTAGSEGNRATNFLVENSQNGSDTLLYGFKAEGGGTNKPKLFINSDTDANWTALTNAESANNSLDRNVFIKFKGKYYGRGSTGQRIWSYDSGATTYVEDASGGTLLTNNGTSYCNAIIGKSNGYLYIPIANILYYFDGTTWGTATITIPSDENIIGLTNYGNYLAILTSKSYIYLWDFAKTLADEIVELEDGSYSIFGSIGGVAVAIGQKVTPSGSEIVMSQWSGGTPDVFFRKILPSTVTLVQGACRNKFGKIFFAVNDTATGRPYQGIWAVGKRKIGYPFAVTIAFDYLENGGSASNIVNFDVDYNHLYVATADYKVHKLSLTTNATATPISYLETTKYMATDEAATKAVVMSYAPLPSAGVVTLYYRKDEETSWTQIFQDTADSSVGHSTDVVEGTTTVPLPEYSEIQFRMESLGGAEITGFAFKAQENRTIYSVEK